MKYGREKMKKKKAGFVCVNCHKFVSVSAVGTRHRNHCPYCLWSKHLDRQPGDRKAICGGAMKPIGLTFKYAGVGSVGELMVVHRCESCGLVGKNRIAGDDHEQAIVELFQATKNKEFSHESIVLLSEKDETELMTQLFGKNYAKRLDK